jgi:hypothetical protein
MKILNRFVALENLNVTSATVNDNDNDNEGVDINGKFEM